MSGRHAAQPSVMGSSAVMAAGTVVSRLSGFVRSTLLAAALGVGLHADVFTIANTIPNMLYILLAGGVFNAVLVPQLVRAMRKDPDGGAAYTNRVITLAAVFLLTVTVLLVVAAPLVMRVLLDRAYFTADFAVQRESIIDLARYCLPQVFFYGMFVLVGQVLNARGRFGPMMWAPIANNVISVLVLVTYLLTVGAAKESQLCGGYSSGAEALLGIGSTLGIAAQFAILVPYLRRAGFTFRPRFDFRGSGLGHTFRLGLWTVLFVVVNQIAYTVVVRIASSGTIHGAVACHDAGRGTGYTVYSNAFLLAMVPHAVITVSLATAVLPRLSAYAAEGDLRALGEAVSGTVRSTYALVLPVVALLPIVAADLSSLVWGYGASAETYSRFVTSLSLFAIGLFFFTTHYLMLRGFYALEQTRRVFFIQCAVAAANIVAAVLLTRDIDPIQTAPRLVIAYAVSYAVGSVLSYRQLSAQVGGLGGSRLVRFGVRIVVAAGLSAVLAWLAREGIHRLLGGTDKLTVLVHLGVIGLVGLVSYLVLARVLRLEEVGEVTRAFTGRVRGSSSARG
ncbi:murein biosynthesis integral membrane protein MurJ [Nocardioides pocheonensis]|uniref:Murein biosynthesis integral membrane protein MurJ n=1 Tax=Nocardioides pocheonensis TaxID=661485 RepID=A0A3N0GKZ9_9ACTN|nr:murein biosynthesis integral membrane protein MurJ [Nocardioides pocheonensis]RNM12808.1 murein biosynthesis integral membrane protein MurJ [Nocardioides pocheonensis]